MFEIGLEKIKCIIKIPLQLILTSRTSSFSP